PPSRIVPRSGHPCTYDADQRAAALTDPKDLGLPFGCWTLDRLRDYLNEQKGIPIKRSCIDELLRAESLRWRHLETSFGGRVAPVFERRGPSIGSTRRLQRAGSSASTRLGHWRPGATPAKSPSAPRRRMRPMAAAARPPVRR